VRSILFYVTMTSHLLCAQKYSNTVVVGDSEQISASLLWETANTLSTPESAIFDDENKLIYVININGDFQKKDGNGYVSKLSLKGEILNLKWVTGLNAPTGSALYQGYLLITDIDEIIKINIQSGEISQRLKINEAKNLNDIAITSNGTIYVSDTLGNSIYKINANDSTVRKWAEIPTPNGVALFKDQVCVTSWGQQCYWVLNEEGSILYESQDLKSPLDGNIFSQNGMLYIAGFDGKIFCGKDNGPPKILIDYSLLGNCKAADIVLIPDPAILLVPTYEGNTVKAFTINTSL